MQKIKKTKRFRLLTVLLAVVMMFALSIQAYAATSKPVTQDGITATLVTDKDSYKAGESANATVKIENNTGKDVFIFTQITVPSAVKLAGANAFDAVLANGQSWTSAAGVLGGTAGATATGDNMQAGLWSVVSLLAIGGVVALLVYGKNRKTWISMMLCVVMIGGLMAAAVPAQAAGVSGSMSVSCPIQIDGKAAEVTAIVNYIIGYEAASNSAANTTPSETTTTAPTEAPTEAPTSAPTETPTVAPTETPTEAPTEAPAEDEVPSESAYYVVWDDFTFSAINGVDIFSSWDTSLPTGVPTKVADGASFVDGSVYAGAQALRAFNAISDDFTLEFSMRATAGMTDTLLDLRNGDTTAIHFAIKGDKLYLGNAELCALPTDRLANFKLHISPANGTYTLSIDGATIMDGEAAKEFAFLNDCASVDRIYIETGKEDMGRVVIGTVRAYVDYYVNEKFLDGTKLTINDEWTVTGNAATIFKQGTQGPDNYNALLKDGSSITREVAYEQDGAWVEYQHLMEENVGEFSMILSDDAGNTFKVATINGKFGYYNGEEFVGLYDCLNNMWYHVMLKQTDDGTKLYLNHKLKAEEIALPFEKFTNITFTAEGGEAMLDDIVVKDWIPLPDDYVPEPVAVEKEEGTALVGLQSCNLWVEGEHFGYDWLTDWEERTPVLGYYDEITTESADWELKFKVEHGIDFELYCWYRPADGQGEPVKMARNAKALHEGYMNAEYSNMMKFAITWESGTYGKDFADFKENIVPYWIEQYFKDDRYLVIDNKPVVGMYNIAKLQSYFGGTIAGVKTAMDYLRQACVEAGFDGAYIIMCNATASSAAEIAQASFDGQYAYTWGSGSYAVDYQTKGMESIQNALVAAGQSENGVVPVATMGWWNRAWNLDDGKYCTVENFQKVLEWIRDDFMPTLDENSIGSKMVLLDNWNEYGEGHFIMPSELAGFGYLDAVRAAFGDGDGINGAHTVNDIVPDEAQRARINHMYIQDRHVVVVDKETGSDNLEVIEGCDWQFNTNDDTEGWTVGANDGRWIKDLKEWAVKDGKFHGITPTPAELEAAVASGELPSGATADPSLMSPDNLNLSASEAITIKVRMKGVGGEQAMGQPEMFFTTTNDTKFTGTKRVATLYDEAEDGYAELTFDMASNDLWTGTIKQLRLDPIYFDGEFWIDSIQILKRADGGDAEIYLEGDRVYTDAPIEAVDGTYMFPADELSTMTSVYVRETLEKDRLYVCTETAFYEFPYEGDVKMLVNGGAVDSVGVATINDTLYVPIVDIFENIGTVTDNKGEVHPAYEITVTPATGDANAKININKFVDSSILKAYYFTSDAEGWNPGGITATYESGTYCMDFTGSTNTGAGWKSPLTAENQLGLNPSEVGSIRATVKVEGATPKTATLICYSGLHTGETERFVTTANYELVQDNVYIVEFDCTAMNRSFGAGELLNSVRINGMRIADVACQGKYYLDSVEFIRKDGETETPEVDYGEDTGKWTEGDATYASMAYGWYFADGKETWFNGGATSVTGANGFLVVTGADTEGARTWSGGPTALQIPTADVDTVRIRVNTAAEAPQMMIKVGYNAVADGTTKYYESTKVSYEPDEKGWAVVVFDLSSVEYHTDAYTISSVCLYPLGQYTETAATGTANVDYVELLKKSADSETPEEPVVPETPEGEVIKGWYLDADSEGWQPGGVPNSHGYDASKTAYKLETKANSTASLKGPDVTSEALTLSDFNTIRIQLTGGTPNAVFTLGTVFNNAAHTETICQVDTREVTLDADGNATIEINCSEATLGTSGVLETIRINVTSAGVNTCYIDSVELLQKEKEVSFEVIQGWYFEGTKDGFSQGGALNSIENAEGTLLATAGDNQLRIWTPSGLNIATADVTHLRIVVKSNATDPVFSAYGEFDGATANNTVFGGVAYTANTEEFQEIFIDLTASDKWTTFTTLDRLCIYPFAGNVGSTANIDSVELVKVISD